MNETVTAVLGVFGTFLTGLLVYLGVRYTADRTKAGQDRDVDLKAQDSAIQAWKDLIGPYRNEVKELRDEVKAARVEQSQDRKLREAEMALLHREVASLRSELAEWKRLARVIARWAMKMRDQVLHLGGAVDATPEELLTLQAMDEAGRPLVDR